MVAVWRDEFNSATLRIADPLRLPELGCVLDHPILIPPLGLLSGATCTPGATLTYLRHHDGNGKIATCTHTNLHVHHFAARQLGMHMGEPVLSTEFNEADEAF